MITSRRRVLITAILFAVIMLIISVFLKQRNPVLKDHAPVLTVGIAPYQDLAMLVVADPAGIARKHNLDVKLVTMAWEDILPAVASRGKTIDVGFGSYVEYLTKYSKLNDASADPIVYLQPLYVYKGGGFAALRSDIPVFTTADLQSTSSLLKLKQWHFGAQKESLYDMMLFTLAARAGITPAEIQVSDTPMNDGVLALESKSLDLAAAGLTQVTEITKRGGHLAIPMENAGFADITGFVCRKSVLDSRRTDIENLIRVWFDCVAYVYADMRTRSEPCLTYLKANAATQYSYEQYATALSQEYLPRSLEELNKNVLQPRSKYDYVRIGDDVNSYLTSHGIAKTPAPIPNPVIRF